MSLKQRIIEDYFKHSRLEQYREVLQAARDSGYRMVGILDLYREVSGGAALHGKLLINRHDIDTSPRVAGKFFEIERAVYGREGSATYYFRRCTFAPKLIAELEAYGYETGYHYEEIAEYEKRHKLRSVERLRSCFTEIGTEFLRDLEDFRARSASRSLTVASHGDFINTRLKLQNNELLKDRALREAAGVLAEAYDPIVNDCVRERFADQKLLGDFSGKVLDAIGRECPCIMMLTHPRNWEVDRRDTTRENAVRLVQGLAYRRR